MGVRNRRRTHNLHRRPLRALQHLCLVDAPVADTVATLASRYDAWLSNVQEVAVTACSSNTDKPFTISLDNVSYTNTVAYGFNDSIHIDCLRTAWADYSQYWQHAAIDYTLDTYRRSDHYPNTFIDPKVAVQVMHNFRAALGLSRAIIAQHGLQDPLDPTRIPIWDEFLRLGPAIEVQTNGPSNANNASITLAFTYFPTEIEIWDTVAAGGNAQVNLIQLQQWATELRQINSQRSPSPSLLPSLAIHTYPPKGLLYSPFRLFLLICIQLLYSFLV